MIRALLALTLAAGSTPVLAAPLTVQTGETWLFAIDHGEPVKARKVDAATKAAAGEVKVDVRALFGTMMTLTNNSRQGYTFRAELLSADGKAVTARSCTLPPGNQPTLESWPQKATAVRIGSFKPAKGGHC
ncbi:MAG: hypothetical protein ACJ8EH_05935 [Sphingomicrobium sp.]|jgi:hypothetical protein